MADETLADRITDGDPTDGVMDEPLPARTTDCNCGPSVGDGASQYPFVYALGRIDFRFPNLGLEREFLQANRDVKTKGLSDPQARYAVLSEGNNRYLARQLCWVMSISRIETYILQPADGTDLDLFIEAMRPPKDANDEPIDQVVGVRGPNAPATVCNGLMLPVVRVDQLYSYTRRALIDSIPKPEGKAANNFDQVARDLFERRILQMADNAGVADEHRAINYLAVRYPQIYAATVQQAGEGRSLVAIDPHPSRMSGARRLVNVIFEYGDRAGTSGIYPVKLRARVDVTDEFPFLDMPLSPYFDR